MMIASQPPSPLPTPPPKAFRAVALARKADRIIIAGGDVLRVRADCTCAPVVPGRPIALELDANGVITTIRPAGREPLRPASELPASAIVYPTISTTNGDPRVQVTITISVTVPAQTPPTDTVYLSTERSNWKVDELRMNRVDGLHWEITLTLPRGAHLTYRYTRGSYATTERNEERQFPPPRTATATEGLSVHDTIPYWADIN
jgi:hypothetical protein